MSSSVVDMLFATVEGLKRAGLHDEALNTLLEIITYCNENPNDNPNDTHTLPQPSVQSNYKHTSNKKSLCLTAHLFYLQINCQKLQYLY